MGSICHFSRALPASIGEHCSQVLIFNSIWGARKKGCPNHTFRAVLSRHLDILGTPQHTTKQGKTQNDKSTLFYPPPPPPGTPLPPQPFPHQKQGEKSKKAPLNRPLLHQEELETCLRKHLEEECPGPRVDGGILPNQVVCVPLIRFCRRARDCEKHGPLAFFYRPQGRKVLKTESKTSQNRPKKETPL